MVLGSNGDSVYLSEKEKIEVLKITRQAIPKNKLLIAGTGCESTRNTIDLTLKAAQIGADAAIIVNPSYYKSEMTVPMLAAHYHIIGVKDTGGVMPKMGESIRQAAPGFQVLAGSASFRFQSLAIGAVAGVLALANIAPNESVEIYRLFGAGDMENGRALHLRMLPVNAAITTRFGVSGLKTAMDMLGYQGGLPRSPLLPLPELKKQELQIILKKGGLL